MDAVGHGTGECTTLPGRFSERFAPEPQDDFQDDFHQSPTTIFRTMFRTMFRTIFRTCFRTIFRRHGVIEFPYQTSLSAFMQWGMRHVIIHLFGPHDAVPILLAEGQEHLPKDARNSWCSHPPAMLKTPCLTP